MSGFKKILVVAGSRNSRLLVMASAISAYGDWLFLVGLDGLMLDLGGGWGLALGHSVPLIAGVLFAPVAGMLCDRYARRTLMIVSDLMRAGIMFALSTILLMSGGTLASVLSLVTCGTLCGGVFRVARASVIPDAVPPDDLLALNAVDGGVRTSAMTFGPALTAVAVQAGTYRPLLFSLNGITFIIAALLALRLRLESRQSPLASPASPCRQPSRWLDVVRTLCTSRTLAPLSALALAINFTAGALFLFLPIRAQTVLGGGDAAIGYLAATFGAGTMIGTFATPLLVARASLPSACAALLPGAVALFVAGASAGTIGLLIAIAVIGFSISAAGTQVITLLQSLTEDEVRGRVFALVDGLATAAQLGGIAAGWLAARGLFTVAACVAMVVISTTVILLFLLYTGQRRRGDALAQSAPVDM